MVVLALLLILLGAGLLLAGLSTAEATLGDVEILGVEVSAVTLFILGAVAAALILFGLWTLKYGAKREWRLRKERKKYEELGEKLGLADDNRRRDLDEGT